jgi:hypothetical protein
VSTSVLINVVNKRPFVVHAPRVAFLTALLVYIDNSLTPSISLSSATKHYHPHPLTSTITTTKPFSLITITTKTTTMSSPISSSTPITDLTSPPIASNTPLITLAEALRAPTFEGPHVDEWEAMEERLCYPMEYFSSDEEADDFNDNTEADEAEANGEADDAEAGGEAEEGDGEVAELTPAAQV